VFLLLILPTGFREFCTYKCQRFQVSLIFEVVPLEVARCLYRMIHILLRVLNCRRSKDIDSGVPVTVRLVETRYHWQYLHLWFQPTLSARTAPPHIDILVKMGEWQGEWPQWRFWRASTVLVMAVNTKPKPDV